MQYHIEIDRKAVKYLQKMPIKYRRQVSEKINSLGDNPRPQGYKQLKKDLYRIRSGNYRIIYTIKDKQIIVYVLAIGDRKDVYTFLENI